MKFKTFLFLAACGGGIWYYFHDRDVAPQEQGDKSEAITKEEKAPAADEGGAQQPKDIEIASVPKEEKSPEGGVPSEDTERVQPISIDDAVQMLKKYGILDPYADGKLVTSASSRIGKEYKENPIKAISEEFLYHIMMYNDGVESISEYPYIDKAFELYRRANTEQQELQAQGLAKLRDDTEALQRGMEEAIGAVFTGQSPPQQEAQVRILRRLPLRCLEAFAAKGVKISNYQECDSNIFAVDPPDIKLLTFLYAQCAEASPDRVNAADANGWTPLMTTARYCTADVCRRLIQAGANVNVKKNDGWTALMLAARYSTADVCRMLLQAGAKVDEQNNDGATALMLATCNAEHPDVCRVLSGAGASVHAKSKDGRTPLMWAARYAAADVCRMFLQVGAKVDEQNNDGATALMLATCNAEHPDVCRVLSDAGASVHAKNKDGRTPLMWAARYASEDVCRMFLQAGAKVDEQNDNRATALMLATCNTEHPDVCRVLSDAGASVHAKDKDGWTPLMWATQNSAADVCRMLIQRGADVNAESNNGRTVIAFAVLCGDDDKVDLLIQNHADVRVSIPVKGKEFSLLELAKELDREVSDPLAGESSKKQIREQFPNAKLNYRGVVKLLEAVPVADVPRYGSYEAGDSSPSADRESSDSGTATPISSAELAKLDPLIARMRALRCKEASSALYQARLLTLLPMIRNGADVNITLPETKGNTALHYSCAIGSWSITQWLVNHGADVNALTDKGASPLDCVGVDNAARIRALLLSRGARRASGNR